MWWGKFRYTSFTINSGFPFLTLDEGIDFWIFRLWWKLRKEKIMGEEDNKLLPPFQTTPSKSDHKLIKMKYGTSYYFFFWLSLGNWEENGYVFVNKNPLFCQFWLIFLYFFDFFYRDNDSSSLKFWWKANTNALNI